MQVTVGSYRFEDDSCTLDTDFSNNNHNWRDMTIDEEGRNHLNAYTERVTNGFNIAVNRAPFTSFDDVRYGARVRYRFIPKNARRQRYGSWIDDEICCYLKEVKDARIASSKFTRFFLNFGLQPTTRLRDFIS